MPFFVEQHRRAVFILRYFKVSGTILEMKSVLFYFELNVLFKFYEMKKFLVLSLFSIYGVLAYSQPSKPALSFGEQIFDFGEIKEDGGMVSHEFKFVNTGDQPLVIHHVRASCGCTTPDWTRRPVQGGKEGFVKVTFDPRNRPGNFNKSISVSSNGEPSNMVLRVTGKVLPRERTIEDIYPREMGGIRMTSSHLSFTRIAPDAVKNEQLEVINTSGEPIKVTFDRVPEHIQIHMEPQTLKPGEKGVIEATYNAALKKDWGFVVDQVYLNINGKSDYNNRLSVSATIEEDYSTYTAQQMALAPDIQFKDKVFDFGEIKQGARAEHAFELTNQGKSDLILRKVKASCGCTAIEPDKMIIKPGESAKIVAVFNSRGMNGRQNKSVTVYSNDPKKSTILLRLTGTVVQ